MSLRKRTEEEAVRLNDDDTVEFIDNGEVLSRVDLGIVKCHFEIGANKTEKEENK